MKHFSETIQEGVSHKSTHSTDDGGTHTVKSAHHGGTSFSGTVQTSHRHNRYTYTGPESISPVVHEKPLKWKHDTTKGTTASSIHKSNKHLDDVQARAIAWHLKARPSVRKEEVEQIVEAYKVGDTVVPTIGPHKGHPHTVIHVHSTGEVNIKPKGLTGKRNRYRMGATTAQPHHLNPHTVAESAACPDCGCDPCKCKKIDEDYTAMKGKESFMKKKPVDVKYDPRWHVMSHGKTMERPTKEEVEQIDELSRRTMTQYLAKASMDYADRQAKRKIAPDNERKLATRGHGIYTSAKRLSKEEVALDEATVKTRKYSWGTMKTVQHGHDFSIPLHPEHHQELAKLRDGGHHEFKDETGRRWKAHRQGEDVHFQSKDNLKTSVKHHDLTEGLKDACWKGYEAIGMKEKGGKKVPNCVPVKEESRTATDTEHKASMKKLFSMPETKKTLKSLKRRDQDPDYDAKKQAQYRKKLMGEQTPAGGVGGPESAGVPMGGDVSTRTVSGPDTTRKGSIIRKAVKSAQDKQKKTLGSKDTFDPKPETQPLVVTAHMT